jgi:hypothetical protein
LHEETLSVQKERSIISEKIKSLQFNKKEGGKFLVMLSGDVHIMAQDNGSEYTNPFGSFPIFQCSPIDNKSSCKLSSPFTNFKSYGN